MRLQRSHLSQSRNLKFCLFLFPSLVFLLFSPIYSQNKEKNTVEKVTTLEAGKIIEREFADGLEKHIYQITLSANQYVNAAIDQRGVDVVARIFAADGKLIADVDLETLAEGTEKIELVAETAGNYRIEIKPSLPKVFTGKYTIRLSEAHDATANEKLLDQARRQYYEALRLGEDGKFEQALEFASRALEIREKILSLNHTDVTASVLLLGRLYVGKRDFVAAEKFSQRAAEAFEKNSGKESLNYSDALHVLARLRLFQGKNTEAQQIAEQSLAIREKAAGSNGLAAANSLFVLATIYQSANNYPEAEKNFLKVLVIREKLLGENHFEVAQILNDLGLFYYGAGDYSNASALLQRSLAIKEKLLASNHRQIGLALNNLGLVEWKKGDYEKAKTYYLRALNIFEIANGPDSDGVASISLNLGIIYKEDDRNYVKAEEYYRRALSIYEKNFGENYQGTATSVSSLSILYRAMGDYDRAEQFQLRALSIYEKISGLYSRFTILSLVSLIRIYAAKGDINRAIEYQKRLSAVEEKILPLNLTIGSERQKIAYYEQLDRINKIITLHASLAPDSIAARDLAITRILQHKGRILDAVSENLTSLRRRFNAQDQELLDGLSNVNAKLSQVILSGRQKISVEEQQNQIKTLEAEQEKIESEISRRSAGFYTKSQPVTLAAVQSAIPADAALVEFIVYFPFVWKAKGDEPQYGDPRYIAYVARRSGEVQWKELGDAKTIDTAIGELRKALRDPKRNDVSALARTVDEKVMQPVRKLTGEATHLLVSPDGELNLIPLEALIDEKGNYLIENYSFTYLTSGRDLLRMQVRRESKSKSLIVANPSFGETLIGQSSKVKPITKRDKRQSIIATRSLSDTYFAPLGGTLQEARSIQTLFPEATFLTGAEATESVLKQTVAPRLLHVATHGFFLQNAETGKDADLTASSITKNEIENPLLRSGLALTGANQHSSTGDDGILTALEASGLNLWGTKLVVLSACDTGVGEVKNGEGVYGLRRAFFIAGTESLVMSLWSVSDYVTRGLMTNYYKNLKQGMGRGASLRQVQLEMLKLSDRRHPFYWAGFIQSGEWANLDGKR